MTITGEDEDIHPRGTDSHYLENYLFAGLSDTSDFGFYVHLSRMFEIGTLELHAATFDGSDVVTCLERHDLDETEMLTPSFRYEIVEPLREWRLRYAAVGRTGAFIPNPARELRDVRFDIRLRAPLPPADMTEAFHRAGFGGLDGHHYEQGFVWHGEITVGDRTVRESGLGLRDHSWGKRHMTEHNTTWWFPSVGPAAKAFYTGLEIRRGERRMAAATRSDETATTILDDLDVTVLAGDQVSYTSAQLTYGSEPPAIAHGVCRIPMPWLIGQGLPRLSDDLFCRVQMPDGSRGFALVEMSRAATEAEQAGFGALIDTRSAAARQAAGDGVADVSGGRDIAPRVRALEKSFPVDWSQFYTRSLPGHVERVVLASMLADIIEAPEIDRTAVSAYRDLLIEYRSPLEGEGRNDLVVRIDALAHRRVGRGELNQLMTDVMAALPLRASQEHAAEKEDVERERLHRAAVSVDVQADVAHAEACRRHVGDRAHPEPIASTAETDELVKSIDTSIDAHFGLQPGTAAGRITAGGLSKVTLTYEIVDPPVVVRADRGAKYSGAPVQTEYRTIAAANEAGVPAPKPVAFVDGTVDHPPYSIVERIEGSPLPGIPSFRDATMCRQLAEILAAIHRIPLNSAEHIHGFSQSTVDRVLADLERRSADWRAAGCANPLSEFTFQWLRVHAADGDGPRVVVHGDYRPHNMLGIDRRITGVLDWEHSKIGNAAEDLAYVRPAAEALASWPEFLDAYVAAGGRAPSERELRFYEVSGSLFNTTILDQMELEFATDESRPLAMIATVLQARPVMRARIVSGVSSET